MAAHQKLEALSSLKVEDLDSVLFGQGPMYTFYDDEPVHKLCASCYEAGEVTGVFEATCILLKTRTSEGKLLVDRKTWTGFANSEGDFAEQFVGMRLQPFRIEDEVRKITNTNFIVASRFNPACCA